MKYQLKFIKGVKDFVLEDLQKNFADKYTILNSSNLTSTSNLIELETDISDIDEFRKLKTVLHISLIDDKLNTPNPTDTNTVVERNLSRPEWRKHLVPAGINPTLAHVMCAAANLQPDDILMDPFCGGGTIPITAILDFDVQKILCSDISSKAVNYTKQNFAEAKINKNKYSVFISDIKRLRIQKNYLTKIVTNMPFGIRAGKHNNNIELYKTFINYCYSALDANGTVVALTTEKTLIIENIKGKFEIIKEIKIAQGGLYPSIFVLKKV